MKARARATDPETSHEAAESLDEDTMRRSQADVYWVMARCGPVTDTELINAYRQAVLEGIVGRQSESGIRTRRKELVVRGAVVDSGMRDVLRSGRRSTVWKLA